MGLFWIPGVAPAILETVSDVDQELIKEAVIVLQVFSFFPIPCTVILYRFVRYSLFLAPAFYMKSQLINIFLNFKETLKSRVGLQSPLYFIVRNASA